MDDQLKVSVSGLRGVIGGALTPGVVVRYAASVLHHFLIEPGNGEPHQQPRLVIARDGRLGSDVVRDLAGATARAAGVDVIDIGVAMTPTAGVMAQHHEAIGALVATASHNPQQWCGLKPITRQARAPAPSEADAIVRMFEEGAGEPTWAQAERLGDLRCDETAAHVHVARCLAALERLCAIDDIKRRQLRVAVDSVNASGVAAARLLLDALGCQAVLLNDEPTGVFAHPPEPLPEHLSQLCETVKERRCDVGFAQDPDGDRLVVVDEQGRCLSEEKTLALATLAILSARDRGSGGNDAVVVANLSTSRMIDDIAAELGARVARTPVGEANVAQAMVERGAVIGGEGAGGVIWPEVGLIRDSASAMALTLALMTREGASVRELALRIPEYAMRKRKVQAPADLDAALEAVAGCVAGARVDRSDGVRLELSESRAWLHVRGSNTEPVVRIIAEAPDATTADGLIAQAEAALRSVGQP